MLGSLGRSVGGRRGAGATAGKRPRERGAIEDPREPHEEMQRARVRKTGTRGRKTRPRRETLPPLRVLRAGASASSGKPPFPAATPLLADRQPFATAAVLGPALPRGV
ncbi:MAG: hypothetical protein BJ554DRAFT_403 [Olpidium bornovanus]|uniref:Uncharacterized protein n=1 Tax=Olpidium bornovanus TaxID=278681 RepID=A0A8H7ZTQ9_9FUNG|nr:MAG: hypothetical protein BJ554DRAFT_403 [Olpidium bornovanus]